MHAHEYVSPEHTKQQQKLKKRILEYRSSSPPENTVTHSYTQLHIV